MTGKGGVWIDHREAIGVVLDSDSDPPLREYFQGTAALARG